MIFFTTYIVIAWMIRLAMVPVILRRQFAPGASVAWLGIIFLHPYIGYILYMLVGETRLGPGRAQYHRQLVAHFRTFKRDSNTPIDHSWSERASSYEPLILQAEKISGMPVVAGNSIDFITSSPALIDRLIADIDSARNEVNLIYYIFAPDSVGRSVVKALERAAQRGVKCRLLVDAVGSRPFLKDHDLVATLRAAGVELAAALPAAFIQRRVPRMDLRNHRKIAVIDVRVALFGSQNIIHPDYGGRVGAPWIDLSGRITGPIVTEFSTVFAEDWAFETGEELPRPTCMESPGFGSGISMQVIPTGPSKPGESYRRVLLAALQCARERAIVTTPYFVPDEPALVAFQMAADRGVKVDLILPARPDHLFTALAGRAHFSRLMEAGISIWQYRPGLLHSKSITIDDELAVFGSANVDVRSFNLNFELSLLLYGAGATGRLREIQMNYIAESNKLELSTWQQRSKFRQYTESAVTLLSPLL